MGGSGTFISRLLQNVPINYAMLISSQPLPPPHPASTLPLSLQIYLRLFDFLFVKSRSYTLLPVGFFLIMSKITIHFLKLHTSISVRCLLECLCTITTLWHQFHLKNSRVSLFFFDKTLLLGSLAYLLIHKIIKSVTRLNHQECK